MRIERILKYLLYILAFSVPFFPRSPNVNKFLFFILAFFWIYTKKISLKNPLTAPVFSFLGFSLLSAAIGENPQESVGYFFNHTINFLMIFAVAECIEEKETFFKILEFFVISAAIVCIIGILQYISQSTGFMQKEFKTLGMAKVHYPLRIYSTRGHPLVFGDNLALYIPLTLSLIFVMKRKFIYVITLFLMFLALFLSKSRVPIFASILSCLVFLIFNIKKINLKHLVAGLGVILVMFFLFAKALKDRPIEEFKKRMNFKLGGRETAWQASKKIIKENFLFGVGPGNERRIYQKNARRRYPHLSHFHSTPIQIFVATGIWGFLAFLWGVFVFFKTCVKRVKNAYGKEKILFYGFLFAFFSSGITGLTDYLFLRPEIYYPVFFLSGVFLSMEKFSYETIF